MNRFRYFTKTISLFVGSLSITAKNLVNINASRLIYKDSTVIELGNEIQNESIQPGASASVGT